LIADGCTSIGATTILGILQLFQDLHFLEIYPKLPLSLDKPKRQNQAISRTGMDIGALGARDYIDIYVTILH